MTNLLETLNLLYKYNFKCVYKRAEYLEGYEYWFMMGDNYHCKIELKNGKFLIYIQCEFKSSIKELNICDINEEFIMYLSQYIPMVINQGDTFSFSYLVIKTDTDFTPNFNSSDLMILGVEAKMNDANLGYILDDLENLDEINDLEIDIANKTKTIITYSNNVDTFIFIIDYDVEDRDKFVITHNLNKYKFDKDNRLTFEFFKGLICKE